MSNFFQFFFMGIGRCYLEDPPKAMNGIYGCCSGDVLFCVWGIKMRFFFVQFFALFCILHVFFCIFAFFARCFHTPTVASFPPSLGLKPIPTPNPPPFNPPSPPSSTPNPTEPKAEPGTLTPSPNRLPPGKTMGSRGDPGTKGPVPLVYPKFTV